MAVGRRSFAQEPKNMGISGGASSAGIWLLACSILIRHTGRLTSRADITDTGRQLSRWNFNEGGTAPALEARSRPHLPIGSINVKITPKNIDSNALVIYMTGAGGREDNSCVFMPCLTRKAAKIPMAADMITAMMRFTVRSFFFIKTPPRSCNYFKTNISDYQTAITYITNMLIYCDYYSHIKTTGRDDRWLYIYWIINYGIW